ncbi:MAG: hypothetical protein Q9168_005364 [Polycauliona sp. 1 TL-2023]
MLSCNTARSLIGNGAAADLARLSIKAQDLVSQLFKDIKDVLELFPPCEVKSLPRAESGPTFLIGAVDPATMFSNYITDMACYNEHGYNHVFPSLEPLLQDALVGPHALHTPKARERRSAIGVDKQ